MRLWQGSAQRVPLSPPLVPIKAILAKLDLKPQVQPGPPPKPGTPSRVMARKRRRREPQSEASSDRSMSAS